MRIAAAEMDLEKTAANDHDDSVLLLIKMADRIETKPSKLLDAMSERDWRVWKAWWDRAAFEHIETNP